MPAKERSSGPLRHADRLNEDTITRLVFEPLNYMASGEAGRALFLAFPEAFACASGPKHTFRDVKVQSLSLWSRDDRASVPDVLIECQCDDFPLRIIVEVKWAGYSLHPGQALLQWQRHRGSYECRHVFLVDNFIKNYLQLEMDRNAAQSDPDLDGWRERTYIVLWQELASRARRKGKAAGVPAERWTHDLAWKLRQWGLTPFEGFRAAHDGSALNLQGNHAFYDNTRVYSWPGDGPPLRTPLFWNAMTGTHHEQQRKRYPASRAHRSASRRRS